MTARILLLICLLAPLFCGSAEQPFEWQTAAPASQGLSPEKLDALRDILAARGTKTLLIVRHDRIVYEWYGDGFGPDKPHYTASLAKALVGGVSLILALQDGRLKPDDAACKYIPEWRDDPLRSKITIRHLATHSSGIQDANQEGVPHEQLPGWMGAFWKRAPEPFTISRDQAPVVFPPGERFAYSNPGMAMLAYAVTASLKSGPHEDIRTLLRERVMRPIGAKDDEWSIGYGRTYSVAGLNLVANWGGANFTARAAARLGRLMLHEGKWGGSQVLESRWVREATRYAGTPLPERTPGNPAPGSGLAWWTNFDGVWRSVPRDAFAGAGAGNQTLLVIPSLDLVVVRNGAQIGQESKGEGFWGGAEKYLFEPLLAALNGPPYRPSPVIRSVRFDPPSTIVRQAIGSDNWPITWGDDGHLYTAYGDGTGFEPGTDRKLSLGFARVEGAPPDFRGFNIRTETGERTGEGPKGAKASGLLMLDGVLYMWVRNTGNATLAWSEDRGKTWQWGFTLDTSFGAPVFLNFGRNYEGARDRFVYICSLDGASAYQPADGIILARVPKDKLRERGAYEFFAGFDGKGRPAWTADVARRRPMFEYPGRCERTELIYNAGLRRYLLTVGYGHSRAWGMFDAPEPWGPWTTAFHTEDWDLGESTHGYRLPTKWISADGKTMWLLFSGLKQYDAFCVRRMQIETY